MQKKLLFSVLSRTN